MKTHSLSLIILVLLTCATSAMARIDIDITSAEMRKIPIAIPYFTNQGAPGVDNERGIRMAELLGQGMELHGFLKVIPTKSYGGGQQQDWRKIGAELTVHGQYSQEADSLSLDLRLLDVASGRTILGKHYKSTEAGERQAVLKFCDEAILTLSGEKGISQTTIAFVSEKKGVKEIAMADLLGNGIRQITKHRHLAISPRFTPDGSFLSYTSYHRGNPNLYLTVLSQDKVTRPISQRGGLNMAPAWHPDGKTMAITLTPQGNAELFLMDRRGQILKQLTKEEGLNVSPSWSPDGSKLAFVSDRSGRPQIYVLELKTRQVKRLTYEGQYNTTPAWSPKGDLIAYSGRYEKQYHIYLISPEGGSPTRLTKGPGDFESPSWSPDGRQIAFSRNLDGHNKIYAIFRNGSEQRRLFDDEGEESMPQWSPRPTE